MSANTRGTQGSRGPARKPAPGSPAVPAAPKPGQGSLLAVYRPDLSQALVTSGTPAYRNEQVYSHLIHRPLQPFSAATALPADFRRSLDEIGASTLSPAKSQTATDGTVKLLLQARDGSYIESVMMPYQKRVTACISSQVGCAVGCAFCATGALGFRRNLSVAEIVDQVRAISALALDPERRISNLVFMGMGEPLLNLQAVCDSIRVLTDPDGMNLANRAISVSTVGIPAGILRLAQAEPQVNLALSLHASDDRTRAQMIPKKHLHPLAEVLDAAWKHFSLTHRKLLVEYVLLRGINDSADDAQRLAGLLRGHVVTVNLLALNPVRDRPSGLSRAAAGKRPEAQSAPQRTGSKDRLCQRGSQWGPYQPSPPAAVAAFRDRLLELHVETVVRRSKGAEIQAACGQLAGRFEPGPRSDGLT